MHRLRVADRADRSGARADASDRVAFRNTYGVGTLRTVGIINSRFCVFSTLGQRRWLSGRHIGDGLRCVLSSISVAERHLEVIRVCRSRSYAGRREADLRQDIRFSLPAHARNSLVPMRENPLRVFGKACMTQGATYRQLESNRILGVSNAQWGQVDLQAQLQMTRSDTEGADRCCFGIEQSIFAAPHTPNFRLLSATRRVTGSWGGGGS